MLRAKGRLDHVAGNDPVQQPPPTGVACGPRSEPCQGIPGRPRCSVWDAVRRCAAVLAHAPPSAPAIVASSGAVRKRWRSSSIGAGVRQIRWYGGRGQASRHAAARSIAARARPSAGRRIQCRRSPGAFDIILICRSPPESHERSVSPRGCTPSMTCTAIPPSGRLARARSAECCARSPTVRVAQLTDHDELMASRPQVVARATGLAFVPGASRDLGLAGETVHIAGLGVDPGAPGTVCRSRRPACWIDVARAALATFARRHPFDAFAGACRFARNPARFRRLRVLRLPFIASGVMSDVKTV